MTENEKIERLWQTWSKEKGEKRSFAEYFSDEHGVALIETTHNELMSAIKLYDGEDQWLFLR